MSWSRNTSWRQGYILTQQRCRAVGLNILEEGELAVAISHDCDIANENLEVEPTVEFIRACLKEERDGNYTHGKNPRILHLEYKHTNQPVFLELLASNKLNIEKIKLEEIQPDLAYVLVRSRQVLQNWLAVRYRRHALPNSLVDRLRPVFKKIEQEGKKNAAGILSFRLSYDPIEELPPKEPYELWLYIVYVTDEAEYESMAQQMAQRLEGEIPNLLLKSQESGTVDLQACEAVSEMEFTLRDMRNTEEYHLEYMSYRKQPPGPVI